MRKEVSLGKYFLKAATANSFQKREKQKGMLSLNRKISTQEENLFSHRHTNYNDLYVAKTILIVSSGKINVRRKNKKTFFDTPKSDEGSITMQKGGNAKEKLY